MVIPVLKLLHKEISLKASVTYNERAFRETVDAFAAGLLIHQNTSSRTDTDQGDSKVSRAWLRLVYTLTTSLI